MAVKRGKREGSKRKWAKDLKSPELDKVDLCYKPK